MVLSCVVYGLVAAISLVVFHTMMLQSCDQELKLFAASMGRAIDVNKDTPYFRDWFRSVKTEPPRSIVTIQLYDRRQRLIEAYGPKSYEQLVLNRSSLNWNDKPLRLLTTDLKKSDGTVVGYLQLELSVDNVEEATLRFAWTMLLTAPLVFAGLGLTSLLVSGQVARPFVDNMNMLRRFMADAGHELNTPLSIAQARTESFSHKLAKQNIDGDDLGIITSSLERMGNILRDLMLLTEVEGPLATQAAMTDLNLSMLLGSTIEEFRERFASRDISLQYNPAPAMVRGHSDSLQRLFANLLENGLRYTEPGGSLTVSLQHRDRDVAVIVQDSGIGIPAASLPLIFDRFYRVDRSRSRASGGSGLGLSIVKAIAEAHKGSVTAQSEVGRGTTFTVTLPAA